MLISNTSSSVSGDGACVRARDGEQHDGDQDHLRDHRAQTGPGLHQVTPAGLCRVNN